MFSFNSYNILRLIQFFKVCKEKLNTVKYLIRYGVQY